MQLHKRLNYEQAVLVFDLYSNKKLSLKLALLKLNIKERRFYQLLNLYKKNDLYRVFDKRQRPKRRIHHQLESAIKNELLKEQSIIQNPDIPIDRYNYSHVRDEVVNETGIEVSVETVRKRAIKDGFFIKRYTNTKAHTRQILTDKPGTILQHDSSHHLFAPSGGIKWGLITTIDDFSRKLLYAKFVENDTTWDHIKSVETVCKKFGIPANYYVDNHSIFRFVKNMDSYWHIPKTNHADVLTSWEQCLKALNIGIFHALSPQAKGKIERPYRWLQDRVVRRCAKLNVISIQDGQNILDEEVYRYNAKTIHSTTLEIPDIRFGNAVKENNTSFKRFLIPAPYRAIEDIFCIREPRIVSGYLTVSWRNRQIKVPEYVPIGSEIILHVVPDKDKPQIRMWLKDELIQVIFLGPSNKVNQSPE